jgi:pimeloyl-ACP methyl ester carboxylesterase
MPRCAYRCLAVIVSGLFAGGLLTGCGGGSPARSDRWHPVTCWFHNNTKLRIDCGYLTVPLHHDRPGGRPVELAVEVIHTPSPHPSPDPVVVLQGGPGGASVGNGNSVRTWYVPFRLLTSRQGGRDLILLDQRGIGHSRPALDCAPIYDLASGLACRNRLSARGIDLSAYTTQENAADVAALGPALGYRQVNLFGWSYGSLLALTVMREHPQHIRSVILLSPDPPQADPVADSPANAARAFRALSDGCAHDPRCAAAYPHLGRDFRTAVTRLDARPRPLTVRINGTESTGPLTGRGLVGLFYQGINQGQVAILPRAIHRAATGGSLGDWAQVATAAAAAAAAPDLGISLGMSQSVECADEAPFVNRQRARAIDAAHPELRHVFLKPAWWFDLCARWPTGPADPAGHTPVHSAIPTLIVTGQYDTGVPPAYGRLVAATLTRSYFTEFPGLAHIPEGPCAESVEANFLYQPLQRPGTSCIQRMPPIPWETG